MSANRRKIVADPDFVGDAWEIADFHRWLGKRGSSAATAAGAVLVVERGESGHVAAARATARRRG